MAGGGYSGCEFAQMFRRFGSQVTVVQRADRLLPGEDVEVSAAVLEGFLADGIDGQVSTACAGVEGSTGAITVGCSGGIGAGVHGSHVLLATGRMPDLDRLGLEHLALERAEGRFLRVDDQLRTSAEDVWELADLRGGPMFTHTARDDAGNLVNEAVIAMATGATYGDIGRAIHVHPTLAEGVNAAAGGVHRPAR